MSTRFKAIVWIDHEQARIVRLGESGGEEFVIHSHCSVQRQHQLAGEEAGGRASGDVQFFHRIVDSLHHIGSTLLTGPGNAKFELRRYMTRQRPELAAHVATITAPDRADDAALLSLAAGR